METLKIALVFVLIGVVLSAEIKGFEDAKKEKASKEIKKEVHELDGNDLDAKKEISTKTGKEVKTEKETEIKTIEKGKKDDKVRLVIPVEEDFKDKDYYIVQKRLKRQLNLGSDILNPLGTITNVTRVLGQIFG